MQNLKHLEVGDKVLVFDRNAPRDHPPTGWQGEVRQVVSDRMLILSDDGQRAAVFDRATGHGKGHHLYALTADVHELEARWDDAERELQQNGVLIDRRARFTADQMEKLVRLVREMPQEDQPAFEWLEGKA
jgi:hypothetical protein